MAPMIARIFRNGRNQAVRIPVELSLDAETVTIERQGDALILRPLPSRPAARVRAGRGSSSPRAPGPLMYLLDTDICSNLMKRTSPVLIEQVRAFAPRELKISVITLFELEYGIQRSARREDLRRIVRAFLENVEVLSWTPPARSLQPRGVRSVATT
jgi:virulence-associated protein VagC